MVSTEKTSEIPDIKILRRLCQSLAILDAILQPEWDLRYFSFNTHWSDGEQTASLRDGSGGAYFIRFQKEGAIILGKTPKSPTGAEVIRLGHTLPGTFDKVPTVLRSALEVPAFETNEIEFCLRRLNTDDEWSVGGETRAEQNHSGDLLFALDARPESYKAWADDYYEKNINLDSVRQVYAHAPITSILVRSLNRARLEDDRNEIGYPATA